jgi:hypothetical protein
MAKAAAIASLKVMDCLFIRAFLAQKNRGVFNPSVLVEKVTIITYNSITWGVVDPNP